MRDQRSRWQQGGLGEGRVLEKKQTLDPRDRCGNSGTDCASEKLDNGKGGIWRKDGLCYKGFLTIC